MSDGRKDYGPTGCVGKSFVLVGALIAAAAVVLGSVGWAGRIGGKAGSVGS